MFGFFFTLLFLWFIFGCLWCPESELHIWHILWDNIKATQSLSLAVICTWMPLMAEGLLSKGRALGIQPLAEVSVTSLLAARPFTLLEWIRLFASNGSLKEQNKKKKQKHMLILAGDGIHRFTAPCETNHFTFFIDIRALAGIFASSYYCHVTHLAGNFCSKNSTTHEYSHYTNILASEVIYQYIANILPNDTQAHFLDLDLCSSIHGCPKLLFKVDIIITWLDLS